MDSRHKAVSTLPYFLTIGKKNYYRGMVLNINKSVKLSLKSVFLIRIHAGKKRINLRQKR